MKLKKGIIGLILSVLTFFMVLSTGLSAFASEKESSVVIKGDLMSISVLDLKTAQQIAVKGNPSLAAAEARLRQAREKVNQAQSSFWPRLNLTGSASRVYMSDVDYQSSLMTARRYNPFADVSDEEDYYKTGLSLTWTIFNGFERKFSNLSALYNEKQNNQAHMEAQRLILSSVAASYYNTLLARENLNITKANESFNRKQLHDAMIRHKVGTGSLSDVLNFEIQINAARTELIRAEQTYEVSKIGLTALMGIHDEDFLSRLKLSMLEPETTEELNIPDSKPLIEYALENRPDILQGEFLLQQAEANKGSARAGFFPTINLTASLDGDRTDDARFEHEDFGESIGVSLSYNLFAGGFNRASMREAEERVKEAEKNLISKKISGRSDVLTALAELKAAQEQVTLQRSNADLVKQNRDLVEKEYAAGQVSLVRLNEAQRDLITAQSRLASALVSMRLSWENLKASTAENLHCLENGF